MTLATFYASVSRSLRRGTSLDAVIPEYVADAARWLEQNYTFSYMTRTEEGQLLLDTNELVLAAVPKTVKFVRRVFGEAQDQFSYLQKIDASQVSSIDEGTPSYYWREGAKILFDGKPNEDLDFQVGAAFYTEWPENGAETPALLALYPNLLKPQAMIFAAIDLKDERMAAAYDAQFQRAIEAALVAEEEDKRENTNIKMQYIPR